MCFSVIPVLQMRAGVANKHADQQGKDRCRVLQCVAVATHCRVLQCVAVTHTTNMLINRAKIDGRDKANEAIALHCSVLQCVPVCCCVLQCFAVCCRRGAGLTGQGIRQSPVALHRALPKQLGLLQYVAVFCNVLQ